MVQSNLPTLPDGPVSAPVGSFWVDSSAAVSWLISGMVSVAVCVVIPVWIIIFIFGDFPPTFGADLAAKIAIAIPPALFGFILLSWRQLERRRILGTLWDVGTFWPRSFHPFAPPCYAERAVPELTRRVWWLNNNKGTVVLAAHSQGAVIAAATALRATFSKPNGPRFGLVTFGAPLRKLYGQGFPAFWSAERIAQLNRPGQSLVLQQKRSWSTRSRNAATGRMFITSPITSVAH